MKQKGDKARDAAYMVMINAKREADAACKATKELAHRQWQETLAKIDAKYAPKGDT